MTSFFTASGRALALALATTFAAGCAGEADVEDTSQAEAPIVDVPNSPVERQAVANCWLYAQASWIEAMATRTFDASQSYWTYWHILGKVRAGQRAIGDDDLSGQWTTANEIIRKYGLIDERSFIPSDAGNANAKSQRQLDALANINASLKPGGALRAALDRGDNTAIRRAYDDAWALGDRQRQWLDQAFGSGGNRTFTNGASNAGTPIIRAEEFSVSYTRGPGQAPTTRSLASAMAEWNKVGASTNRQFLKRVQRALHDRQPVYMAWKVDFNAFETGNGPLRGSFNATTFRAKGPGEHTGIHMNVIEDYQAVLADGTVLQAGRNANAAQLNQALADSTSIQFLRVKNSWGTSKASSPGMKGYNDLYTDYLASAFLSVILPPGY